MTKIVCIGDTHAHPDYNNKRFKVLGQFCAEEQPDYIVQIGDWSDMTSFNSHGTKLEHEGTRWKYDVEVTLDSLHEFEKPIRRRKRKMPRKVITLGNHEHRINRWLNENPKAIGHVSVEMLGFEKFGWTVFPFGRETEIAGFDFVHHLGSQTGRAAAISFPQQRYQVSRANPQLSGTLISRTTYPSPTRTARSMVWTLGCAIHREMGHSEGWSHPTAHKYRRCVWVLDNAANGDADFREVRLSSLGV